ncbi:hypothetical protein F5148DRAFT_1357157 [Russula earlei]|uniref:Uncharacterized protein n=1 Tax=Russula earlei TaxID=71964 RepID=A0ACC0U8Y3_9AGAM|nr:hypothetical protein F5148DRAFT_1357157 [Russula earlei]
MSFRSRRATMRPAREFNVVLRARDQQVSTLQEHNDVLKAQLETFEPSFDQTPLQERKIEQLRTKLHDARAGSAALRRELEDVRRESEVQKTQLTEAGEENRRHLARIAELEEALQENVSTSDAEHLEHGGISRDDILDVLAQVAIDLEAVAKMTEELPSFDLPPDSASRAGARANRVEMGTQTTSDDVLESSRSAGLSRQAQDSSYSKAKGFSEQLQRRIQELEADLDHSRRINEGLHINIEEQRRLIQNLKTSSAQEQYRMASLEDAAKQDQQAIKVLEETVDQDRSDIDGLGTQVDLLRTLLEESRTFNNDLEESYNDIVACKDIFIQDLQDKVEDLTASEAWNQKREAVLHEAQERLAAADIEILELRVELEGAQRNAVTSTNRIIQLEAEASATRQRLRTTDAENGDLRYELGVASERIYALEDELVVAYGRLDDAENTARHLRQELDGYAHSLRRLSNGAPIHDDIHDVNDTDSASDEGSIDTLVMDPDEHSQPRLPSGTKGANSPASANQDEQPLHNVAPLSMRALEARLEAMTLKYEAAEAARICGEDVEDILRAKLRTLSRESPCLQLSTAPALIEPDADVRSDSPSDEWHNLPVIMEEEEPNILPTVARVAPPRIQTCSMVVAKVPATTSVCDKSEPAASSYDSPLLPSPTLSDIWFSDMIALVETGNSVLDWDLPSPGGDSDSS